MERNFSLPSRLNLDGGEEFLSAIKTTHWWRRGIPVCHQDYTLMMERDPSLPSRLHLDDGEGFLSAIKNAPWMQRGFLIHNWDFTFMAERESSPPSRIYLNEGEFFLSTVNTVRQYQQLGRILLMPWRLYSIIAINWLMQARQSGVSCLNQTTSLACSLPFPNGGERHTANLLCCKCQQTDRCAAKTSQRKVCLSPHPFWRGKKGGGGG
jgi:hypothetical protein